MTKNPELIMDEKALNETLEKLAEEIINDLGGKDNFALIGIRTRGVTLAQRMQKIVKQKVKREPLLGTLDITLYRDDLSTLAKHPLVRPTTLPFDVDGTKIVLVDDVLYTGRTIRAALDQIADFGRPAVARLAVLIDRGLREYPIQPDYTGRKIETNPDQLIQVRLKEIDGDEKVVLLKLKNRQEGH